MADLLDEINKHINKMNVTRWNSEYLLLKSMLSIEKNDLESIAKLMDDTIQFSNNDLMILEELINILEPFYVISIKCQQETIVTASLVVPTVVHLLSRLRNMKENVLYCTKLMNQLQSSIEIRFAGIVKRLNQCDIEISDPIYFIATVLDPSFKFYWLRDLKLPKDLFNQSIFLFDKLNRFKKAFHSILIFRSLVMNSSLFRCNVKKSPVIVE